MRVVKKKKRKAFKKQRKLISLFQKKKLTVSEQMYLDQIIEETADKLIEVNPGLYGQ